MQIGKMRRVAGLLVAAGLACIVGPSAGKLATQGATCGPGPYITFYAPGQTCTVWWRPDGSGMQATLSFDPGDPKIVKVKGNPVTLPQGYTGPYPPPAKYIGTFVAGIEAGTTYVPTLATHPDGTSQYYSTWKVVNSSDTPKVEIVSASLVGNMISLKTSGGGTQTGTLQVTITGDTGKVDVFANSGNPVGAGDYQVTMDRTNMPIDTYRSLTAKWNLSAAVSGAMTLQYPWKVLGLVRHSQYNTPAESACTGATLTAYTFTPKCKFTEVNLKSDFMSQVGINGTGISLSNGVLKAALATKAWNKKCSTSTKKPDGANSGNSFQPVLSVTGSCNIALTGGLSVATNPSPKDKNNDFYRCKDNILLADGGGANLAPNKKAHDKCPACSGGFNGTHGHIDNYTSQALCSANDVGDLGNYWTANTEGEVK
jgi:hypothetical protein